MKSLIYIFATHYLGCSNKANEYMHDVGWKKNKNIVLLNGIDLKKFSINNNQCSSLEVKSDYLNFITIGRIDEPKNPFFIVKLIKELSKKREKIHLYWIGSGSLINEVKKLVDDSNLTNYISFLGVRDDVAEILGLMDYMLLPSKWEGLPIVLLEAQATGVPCFISNTITKEIDIGLCTFLSLNEDEKVWANKIIQLINSKSLNEKKDLNKLNKFDIKNTTKKLEEIYFEANKLI